MLLFKEIKVLVKKIYTLKKFVKFFKQCKQLLNTRDCNLI